MAVSTWIDGGTAAGPPQTVNPQVADYIPIAGSECERCHTPKRYWLYNPFVRKSRDNDGWVRYDNGPCRCDPRTTPWLERPAPNDASRLAVDPRWLLTAFHQKPVRRRTFLNVETPDPWRERLALTALEFAHRNTSGRQLGTRGLFLVGPPGTGRGHLLDALANVAHYYGWSTLSVHTGPTLDKITPEAGMTGDLRQEQNEQRRAVRKVALLCLKDVLLDPLKPSELRELDALLTYREEAGLLTHFSAPLPPALLRLQGGSRTQQGARLGARLERLAQTVTYGEESR